jgi:hypothetical protein
MKIHKILISLAVLSSFVGRSNTVAKSLVLNKGVLQTVDSSLVPYYAFNKDTSFNQTNERLKITTLDTLNLSVQNNTADTQQFTIKSIQVDEKIAPGDSKSIIIQSVKAGVYAYSASEKGNSIALWGASGMLVVTEAKDANKQTFYWNIKEFEKQKVLKLDSGKSVDWNTYYPDFFTVNGFGKDQLVGDVASNVVGNVGDSILIMIANTGRVTHSIHFHGYHCVAQEVTSKRVQKASSKDTFPLEKGDGLMLLLVPDKTGVYPVHDHNLIAVSGGGKYPNGVFMVLNIK